MAKKYFISDYAEYWAAFEKLRLMLNNLNDRASVFSGSPEIAAAYDKAAEALIDLKEAINNKCHEISRSLENGK